MRRVNRELFPPAAGDPGRSDIKSELKREQDHLQSRFLKRYAIIEEQAEQPEAVERPAKKRPATDDAAQLQQQPTAPEPSAPDAGSQRSTRSRTAARKTR